eukprot:Tbor_TRINITY_DN3328_c0_g1::TRINITY_DN3328_c0_g1_i1::g.23522::m.23522
MYLRDLLKQFTVTDVSVLRAMLSDTTEALAKYSMKPDSDELLLIILLQRALELTVSPTSPHSNTSQNSYEPKEEEEPIPLAVKLYSFERESRGTMECNTFINKSHWLFLCLLSNRARQERKPTEFGTAVLSIQSQHMTPCSAIVLVLPLIKDGPDKRAYCREWDLAAGEWNRACQRVVQTPITAYWSQWDESSGVRGNGEQQQNTEVHRIAPLRQGNTNKPHYWKYFMDEWYKMQITNL